ncbi:MAG: M48 family metalloprotease [Proteobacteria bacterium]|nr:M48 family metalloprotease [Pseudomonadota bacterium]
MTLSTANRPFLRFFVLVLALLAAVRAPALAQGGAISLVRDSEIENTLKAIGAPIFRAAGIEPESVKLMIVNDNELNAFVTGGNQLFIHTGLIVQSKSPEELAGVIAHETGHMAGHHVLRMPDAMRAATIQSVMAMVAGGLAGAVAGRGDVGVAIAQGGMEMARRQLLAHTRSEENAADQAAVTYLDRVGLSARGYLNLLEALKDKEILVASRQDPYALTHPLTSERVSFVRGHVERSTERGTLPPSMNAALDRLRAKIYGFLQPAGLTLRVYKETDSSVPSRYARAIVHFRQGRLDLALPLIDGLLVEEPGDPYFNELKGQMLFQNHRVREAIGPYERAVELLPDDALLRVSLAQAQLEANDPALIEPAIGHLNRALALDARNPFTWRQLAIGHGRRGEMGESSLALAEEALLVGRNADAVSLAERAKRLLPKGTPAWLRAEDLSKLATANRKQR